MLNPDFPFSYDHYLAHPDGLGSVPAGAVRDRSGRGRRRALRTGDGLRADEAGPAPGPLRGRPDRRPAADRQLPLRRRRGRRPRRDALPGVRQGLLPLRGPARAGDPGVPQPAGAGDLQHGDRARRARSTTPSTAGGPPAVLPRGRRRLEGRRRTTAPSSPRCRTPSAPGTPPGSRSCGTRCCPLLDEQTFYGFIAGSDSFKEAGFAHREAFGQVGFGTGGWDTDFPNSILEILRVVYTDADDQHRLIAGGAQRLPEALWQHAPSGMAHWPDGTSLASLHAGAPRGAVDRIARDGDGDFRDPGALGPRSRLSGRGDHLPVMAAVDADPHRGNPVPGRAVDRDRALALHAVRPRPS